MRIAGLNCRSHGRTQLLCCHIASQSLLQKHTVSASRGIAAAAKFHHNPAPDCRSEKLLNQTRARHTCCRQLAHVQQHDSGVDGCGARRCYFASTASRRPVGCTDRILSHVSQPLLIHNTLQHICASISSKSFMNWTLPDRIGSSHALLALCREPRTWLQLAEAGVERAILQMMLDVDLEVLWRAVEKCFSVLDLQLLTALVQMRTNAIHMVIAVAQLGPSQLRHMVKYVHGSVCQMVFNCMNGAFAHLQNLAQDSEDFAELTLVIAMHDALVSNSHS
jgi:hypothetical protein